MQISEEDIREIVYGYSFDVYTRDYGSAEVVTVDDLVDDILPLIIEKINGEIEENIELN